MNKSLTKKSRCLRLNVDLSKGFRGVLINMACYRIKRSPQASLDGKVVEEVWLCNPIDLSNLSIFCCPAYVHISSEDRSKIDSNSKERIFIGYNKGVKGYKLWDPVKRNMVIIRDI